MPESNDALRATGLFEALLERYGHLLRGAIAQVCPKNLGLDFDDIEQEARMRLWKALEAETEIANPPSYLYRVALTTTLDAVRRVTARREEQLRVSEDTATDEAPTGGPVHDRALEAGQSPETTAGRRLVLRRVGAALAQLSDQRRRAVALYLRGLTPPEIGRLLSWSEPRARSNVYRGLDELRERLAAEGIDYEAR